MDFDDEEVRIDDKGRALIEEAKRVINDKTSPTRDYDIEIVMNNVYEYFSTLPEEELDQYGLQFELFKLERMLKKEFLALNSEPIFEPNSYIKFPNKINSADDCEAALDFIVHMTRKKLSENHNLSTDSLEKNCIGTSHNIERICEELGVEVQLLRLDRDLKTGMFHYFVLVGFELDNGENKNYIVDCTYRQFFIKSMSFVKRIASSRGPSEGSSIGAYMMMTEDRKQMAEDLLTKGYIEATPENMKTYLDAIVFSGRNYKFYKDNGLDFMKPEDCQPQYTMEDYIKILYENGVIEENSILAGIESATLEKRKKLSVSTIGKRTINAEYSDKLIITQLFDKVKNIMKEMGIFK